MLQSIAGRTERPCGEEAYIPKDQYLSRDFARLEDERLWPRAWQIACREEEIPNVGDYVEYTIGNESIVVLRDPAGAIRAYYNACLHRGAPLKTGCGNAKELRCRYHAWRWNLDGTIKEVLDQFDYDPVCVASERLRLPECRTGTWGGFVFINMDPAAPALAEFLDPIPELMARVDVEKMRIAEYRTTVLPGNWKLIMHSFTDIYHLAGVHPQALYVTDETGATYKAFGIHGAFSKKPGAWGRPSAHLGDIEPDPKEILFISMKLMAEILAGFDGNDDIIRAILDSVPDDVDPRRFLADLGKQMFAAEGLDISDLTDDEIFGDDVPMLVMFPNIVTMSNAYSTILFRFRPNGPDPESCLMDVLRIQRFGEGREPKSIDRLFFENWRDHDGWGTEITQDLVNLERVPRGLHSRGFQNLICGRQDLCAWNHSRAISEFMES